MINGNIIFKFTYKIALQFKSVTTWKFLGANNSGGSNIIANATTASASETFKVMDFPCLFTFRTFKKELWNLNYLSS